MKLIIKLFPEIMVKSDSVRNRFIKILTSNLRNILKKIDDSVTIVRNWDYIEIRNKDVSKEQILLNQLQKIPGIHHILKVEASTFTDLDDIFKQTFVKVSDQLINKTFSVRVKRKGKHPFTSIDIERYVGGGLNQNIESAKVKLKNPQVEVNLIIEDDNLYLITERYEGIGGYPVGTQSDVLSLISGGFDSSVASYMFIRRGCRTHYCFFNLGGEQHRIGVQQLSYHLWENYSSSHKVKFITIPFENVVTEILTKIDNALMGVVLKRMMFKAASKIANKFRIDALVTGEAIGQVSSQTLANLKVIDIATTSLVLRPLITHDKEDIIKLAKQIGSDEIASTMPEYCGVISKKPTVNANLKTVLENEDNFNFDILNQAVEDAEIIDIREIAKQTNDNFTIINEVKVLSKNDIIIDIRVNDEVSFHPLTLENNKVINIPFYKLLNEFKELDQNYNYLLYCEQGTMSKIQALYLKEAGYNVGIFKTN